MKRKLFIIIDDGHGQETPGKSSPIFQNETKVGDKLIPAGWKFRENTFNMAVADYLEQFLFLNNISCRQIAPEHEDISLAERVKRQNKLYKRYTQLGFDTILISIHANAYQPKDRVSFNSANGIETFYRVKVLEKNYNDLSLQVALKIQEKTTKIEGQSDRGVKDKPQFYILRNSFGAAVLYEGGFMTNKKELELLATKEYQKRTAQALCEAFIDIQGRVFIGNLNPKSQKRV